MTSYKPSIAKPGKLMFGLRQNIFGNNFWKRKFLHFKLTKSSIAINHIARVTDLITHFNWFPGLLLRMFSFIPSCVSVALLFSCFNKSLCLPLLHFLSPSILLVCSSVSQWKWVALWGELSFITHQVPDPSQINFNSPAGSVRAHMHLRTQQRAHSGVCPLPPLASPIRKWSELGSSSTWNPPHAFFPLWILWRVSSHMNAGSLENHYSGSHVRFSHLDTEVLAGVAP